jgi:hypothetical protein
MALTHKYTLLCDEIRQEINGKYIILGLYTPDIIVPSVPFVLPVLSFFCGLESDQGGEFDFQVQLSAGGNVVAAAGGRVQLLTGGNAALPLRFGPIQLQVAGEYVFSFESPQLDEPVEHRFRVIARPPLVGGGQPEQIH